MFKLLGNSDLVPVPQYISRLESIPDRLDLKELVALFGKDLNDLTRVGKVDLPFSVALLKEAAIVTMIDLAKDFHAFEGLTDGRGGLFAPLRLETIDSSNGCVYLMIGKTVDRYAGVDFEVSVFSSDKDVRGMHPIELLHENFSAGIEGREFLNGKIRFGNGELLMFHRIVDPRYRGSGLGGFMLDIAEGFAQQEADICCREVPLRFDISQLDVLCWLWNNGFQPKDVVDRQKLYAILSAASNLRLVNDLEVWECESYFDWNSVEQFVLRNQYILHMQKRYKPEY